MCDYGDYESISHWAVKKTRRPHECGSCSKTFPAGISMEVFVGKSEGEIGTQYACASCVFAHQQEDETPLHLCWGWGYDPYDNAPEVWEYIHYCLENGEVPTVTGLEAVLAQHAELENA